MNDFDLFWDRVFIPQSEPFSGLDALVPESEPQPTPASAAAAKVTSFSKFSSTLPSLDLVEDATDGYLDEHTEVTGSQDQPIRDEGRSLSAPWSISGPTFEKLSEEMRGYESVFLDGCLIPTHNTLSRGLETYLNCTQKYLPFIHVATFSAAERDVELSLVMAALGLMYRFEHNTAYKLYFMATAIWAEKNRREHLRLAANVICNTDHIVRTKSDKLRKIQTLILLINFASWGNGKIRSDAVAMAGELGGELKYSLRVVIEF